MIRLGLLIGLLLAPGLALAQDAPSVGAAAEAVANGVGMTAVALFAPERPSLIEIIVVQGVYFTALLIAALSRGPRLFAGSIGFLLLGYAAQGLIYAINRVD